MNQTSLILDLFNTINKAIDKEEAKLPLPPPEHLTKAQDPIQSFEAAKAVQPKLAKLYGIVLNYLRMYPGKTTNELSEIAGFRDPRKIGRRLPELEQAGLVLRAGVRKCQITGKNAETWEVK